MIEANGIVCRDAGRRSHLIAARSLSNAAARRRSVCGSDKRIAPTHRKRSRRQPLTPTDPPSPRSFGVAHQRGPRQGRRGLPTSNNDLARRLPAVYSKVSVVVDHTYIHAERPTDMAERRPGADP